MTLADVARKAGVAPMTVSRYLNRHPNISRKTARKVSSAIWQLGYSPNLAARMLMGQPSNAIGLIVPSLKDPFHSEVAQNIQEIARERGVLVWVSASNSDLATENSIVEQMKQHHVDGIILMPTPGPHAFDTESNAPPIVTLDRPLLDAPVDAVLVENRHSSADAVEHLIAHGYKRILCISTHSHGLYTIEERIAGYKEAMAKHRLNTEIAMSMRDADDIKAYLLATVGKGPAVDAIFATNNVTTIHVLEALYNLGLTIPTDIALAGFDDIECAAVIHPAVTVVRQPTAELGRQAARLLFDRIASTQSIRAVTIVLPTTLVIRESCGCNPAQSNSAHSAKPELYVNAAVKAGRRNIVRSKDAGSSPN